MKLNKFGYEKTEDAKRFENAVTQKVISARSLENLQTPSPQHRFMKTGISA